ncbi:shikimate dehydrogenase [Gayadomonas joobiniege]|uniref:shikimate dehydrogenase n=1 Tax=Gayadomonas joobiniege TaxID=1234606 RepID=UPI0003709AE5|nr:shikimate dehydrogenase [Gayadomonas joobiniege]
MNKYAVFGNPIIQSKSPIIHQAFAQQTGLNLEYTALLAPVGSFAASIADFKAAGGKGCNVTMPFKLDAYQLSDELSLRAQLAEAVNTLTFKDGKVYGDNTDGAGLINDLLINGAQLKNKQVLLIGSGGAARGVIKSILDQNPAELVIVNRTFTKAQQLAEHFTAYGNIIAKPMAELNTKFDIVVNSSSTSLTGELPAVSACVFKPGCLAYDMVYKDETTSFNLWALEQGAAKALDGLGMLVGQAAESYKVWHGVMPDINPVIQMLRG